MRDCLGNVDLQSAVAYVHMHAFLQISTMQRLALLLAVGLTLATAQPFLGGQNLLPGGTLAW